VVKGDQLRPGKNRITFPGSAPGVMYRAVFRYQQTGRAIPALDQGIQVTRNFYLLNEQGARQRSLRPGDEVPRGAYLESEVIAHHRLNAHMRYVLVENPKPSCCEVQPVEDPRFNQAGTVCVLREDRTALVAFHHEDPAATITDRCVLHAELAGDFLVPPAVVEMMYQTETRGHSGTFHFRVADGERVARAPAEPPRTE